MDVDAGARKELENSDRESEITRGSRTTRNKDPPVGILRLDIGRARRSSGEFKYLSQGEPSSPQPSVDRLSVTFAEDSLRSDASTRCNLFIPNSSPLAMDKVHFPLPTDEENSDDEDYSASVTAIMQRRASTRRPKKRMSRRTSSPFSPDILPGTENGRRRSSCYTTSSGDTAISMDENIAPEITQDQIFENIRLHKEVLSNVRMQPWPMRKKLRLVIQAKNYIKRHEGALQKRLAQSHSTKDILASWNIYLIKKWQHLKREAANFANWVIPWELRIKEIESHFGSVVASYFTFLRWLFWINLVTSIVLIAFVVVPELLAADQKGADDRKLILKEDKYNATNFLTLWDFEGLLKYSPLFYGWYTDKDANDKGYRRPLAYFMTGLAVYVYSFVATLRKMAENSRMSKLSEKEDECIFSWKLFTSWDYMIGNAETAHNRVASIVMGFKEALLEEAEKRRENKNWKVITVRVLVNLAVLVLLLSSAYAVVEVVRRSTEPEAKSNIWRMNETTVVMNLISVFFPMLFEVLGLCEKYHPRKQLRLQLARIMVLNLLNLYSLIFAHFDEINKMQVDLEIFKHNRSMELNASRALSIALAQVTPLSTSQSNEVSECTKMCNDEASAMQSANLFSALVFNISAATTPRLFNLFSTSLSSWKQLSNSSSVTTEENFDEYFNLTAMEFQNNSTSGLSESIFYPPTVSESVFLNITNGEDTLDFMQTFEEYFELLVAKFDNETGYYKNFSLDYRNSNISFSVNDSQNTYLSENVTEGAVYVTENHSTTTDIFFPNLSSFTESYEYFKSTFSPFLNITDFDEQFETEYKTFYGNITTTVATFLGKSTENNCRMYCENRTTTNSLINTTNTPDTTSFTLMDYKSRSKLRSLCWETVFGQELVKLTVMDLVMTILSTLGMDFFRGVFVRVMNNCWCWDLEKKFPQYADFKVAENILHLVNNQGMVWMGMFFSPGLVVLNALKLYVMVYFRSWTVLTCNVPHKIVFRASRSNNFYYALLLLMLFLCVLPVGYAIVRIQPSWHCGPFSSYPLIFHIFTKSLKKALPKSFHKILDYIASPGIVIPLLVLLILVIYYLISLTNALREANNDLKIQLRRERTEERRKMFQIADRRRRVGSEGSAELSQTPFGKWKSLIHNLPSGKSFDEMSKQEEFDELVKQPKEQKTDTLKTKDFLSKLIKRALRKSSVTSDEESAQEGTDTDQHDSLPEDMSSIKEIQPHVPSKTKRPFTIKPDFNSSFKKTVQAAVRQKEEKMALEARASLDSSDRYIQINELGSSNKEAPVSAHGSFRKRRDTFDIKRVPERRRISHSPSRSSSSKELRQDSVSSTWSDNIPVITISKIESAECILECHPDPNPTSSEDDLKTVKDVKGGRKVDDQLTASSADTLVQEMSDVKHRSKRILTKHVTVDESNDSRNTDMSKFEEDEQPSSRKDNNDRDSTAEFKEKSSGRNKPVYEGSKHSDTKTESSN